MDITRTHAIHMSPRIVFGVGTVRQAGEELARLGVSNALVVTDRRPEAMGLQRHRGGRNA